ncbi:cytochrome P450 [Nocardia wallacei]|uniref:cytochrome P450 n=1 Tax=Nocardia wallacei TaxID=480035 RepID=UPI00245568FA|nr:cytochrome P450 [Nocardia wallacei]
MNDVDCASTTVSAAVLPGALPLLGHGWALFRRPLEFLETQRGLADLVEIKLGPRRAYIFNVPDLVRQMLTTHRHSFVKGGPLIDKVQVLLGQGLPAADESTHRRQRPLVQHAFHPELMQEYAGAALLAAEKATKRWKAGDHVRVDQAMYEISAATIAHSLHAGPLADEAAAEIARYLPPALEGVGRRAALPVPWLHALNVGEHRAYREALRGIHASCERLIDASTQSPTATSGMISVLAAVPDRLTGRPMGRRQLHDEIMSLITGAADTTGALMAWVLDTLAERPDIETKVHAEVDAAYTSSPAASAWDASRFPYLTRVITETLRMRSPVWMLPRRTVQDTEVGGHRIPAGSYVFYSAYANHHDPRLFPEPHHFDPDRWLPEHVKQLPRCAFVPFGFGARKCVGESFAMTEATLVLATLTAAWRFVRAGEPPTPRVFSTMVPSDFTMTVHRRS